MDPNQNRKMSMVVTPKMHYALFLALVISLITTFLLGLLLTETLWGTGLNYFDRLSYEGRVKQTFAQRYEGPTDPPTEPLPEPLPDPSKKKEATHVFESVVDQLPSGDYNESYLVDNDIELGTKFKMTYSYDPALAIDINEHPGVGDYEIDGPILLEAGDLDVVSDSFRVRVFNNIPYTVQMVDGSQHEEMVDGYRIDVRFVYEGYDTFILAVVLGPNDIFSSTALPEKFNPREFTVENLSGIQATSVDYSTPVWGFAGPVTKHTSKSTTVKFLR